MDVGSFIARWRDGEGGQERANYAMFLIELCDVLGVERPWAAGATHARNDYVFERTVWFGAGRQGGRGRIDLYKRGHFVLEAKQSRRADGVAARRADPLMIGAQHQAARYARALPPEHGRPPFLIICDVGRAFELLADFSGHGHSYDYFPDRAASHILIEDLARPDVRDLLRTVWTDPWSLDPECGRPRLDRPSLTAAMIGPRGRSSSAARLRGSSPQTA